MGCRRSTSENVDREHCLASPRHARLDRASIPREAFTSGSLNALARFFFAPLDSMSFLVTPGLDRVSLMIYSSTSYY